jgi:DNA-binding IscR family transcriptional regulator
LAKAPAEITLGEIVRLIEGPTSPIACVSTTGYIKCGFEKKCVFKGVWSNIKERINEVLDNTTFEDMVDKTKKMLGTSVPDFCI